MKPLTVLSIVIGVLALATVTSGCAAKRTRGSDPILRVAIDPTSISAGSYVRLQRALLKSGYFVVSDRGRGYKAVIEEQNRQHHPKTQKRFNLFDKYALWGKLYGVGGVIVANEQCQVKFRITNSQYYDCLESLTLVNATTGEVMSTGEAREDSEYATMAPGWDDVVGDLADNYPKKFINKKNPNLNEDRDEILEDYRTVAGEQSMSQRQQAAEDEEQENE